MKKKKITLELDEAYFYELIADKIRMVHNLKVTKLEFNTGVRGDYDLGTAQEYVERVTCHCEEL